VYKNGRNLGFAKLQLSRKYAEGAKVFPGVTDFSPIYQTLLSVLGHGRRIRSGSSGLSVILGSFAMDRPVSDASLKLARFFGRLAVAALSLLVVTPRTSLAIPLLQLYIEGAEYVSRDAAGNEVESWVLDPSNGPFRLWVIGNLESGPIRDVRLAIAYPEAKLNRDPSGNLLTPQFVLTPSTTGGYGGFTDPSAPQDPVYLQTVTDGSRPKLSNGTLLPWHDVYGTGTDWQEFYLGHFGVNSQGGFQNDSPIGDFIDTFPLPTYRFPGQINVYEVSVLNYEGVVYVDAYDHIPANMKAFASKTKLNLRERSVFAPFSHNAQASGSGVVLEPTSALAWLTLALLGAGVLRKRRGGAL